MPENNYNDQFITPQIGTQKKLGDVLLQRAAQNEPVYGWGQALSKVLAAGAAGYSLHEADKKQESLMKEAPGEITSALGTAAGQWTNPDTGQAVGAGKLENASSIMGQSENPYVQRAGVQNALGGFEDERKKQLTQYEYDLKAKQPTDDMKTLEYLSGGNIDSATRQAYTDKITGANQNPFRKNLGDEAAKRIFEIDKDKNALAKEITSNKKALNLLDSKDVQTGLISKDINSIKNVMASLGIASPQQLQTASDYQALRGLLEESRYSLLIAAKGVQTEGDAQRAGNLVGSIDLTPQGLKNLLELRDIINRDRYAVMNAEQEHLTTGQNATGFDPLAHYDKTAADAQAAAPPAPEPAGITIGGHPAAKGLSDDEVLQRAKQQMMQQKGVGSPQASVEPIDAGEVGNSNRVPIDVAPPVVPPMPQSIRPLRNPNRGKKNA